jgi:hypothetical protein
MGILSTPVLTNFLLSQQRIDEHAQWRSQNGAMATGSELSRCANCRTQGKSGLYGLYMVVTASAPRRQNPVWRGPRRDPDRGRSRWPSPGERAELGSLPIGTTAQGYPAGKDRPAAEIKRRTAKALLKGNPADEVHVVPSLKNHRRTFNRAPKLYAGDRGFDSERNVKACKQNAVCWAARPVW